MTMAPINNAMNANHPAVCILCGPIEAVEVSAQFPVFFVARDETGKPAGANDNECDDESSETGEDN